MHSPWYCFFQVEQVDEASGNAMAEVTTAVVEAILEPLRPAMVAMRAKVEVGLCLISVSCSGRAFFGERVRRNNSFRDSKFDGMFRAAPCVRSEQVLSALDGNVKLSYSGHRKVAYGIQMALLDNPLIQTVDFDYVD